MSLFCRVRNVGKAGLSSEKRAVLSEAEPGRKLGTLNLYLVYGKFRELIFDKLIRVFKFQKFQLFKDRKHL